MCSCSAGPLSVTSFFVYPIACKTHRWEKLFFSNRPCLLKSVQLAFWPFKMWSTIRTVHSIPWTIAIWKYRSGLSSNMNTPKCTNTSRTPCECYSDSKTCWPRSKIAAVRTTLRYSFFNNNIHNCHHCHSNFPRPIRLAVCSKIPVDERAKSELMYTVVFFLQTLIVKTEKANQTSKWSAESKKNIKTNLEDLNSSDGSPVNDVSPHGFSINCIHLKN